MMSTEHIASYSFTIIISHKYNGLGPDENEENQGQTSATFPANTPTFTTLYVGMSVYTYYYVLHARIYKTIKHISYVCTCMSTESYLDTCWQLSATYLPKYANAPLVVEVHLHVGSLLVSISRAPFSLSLDTSKH